MNSLMLVRGQDRNYKDCSQLLLERLYLRFYCAIEFVCCRLCSRTYEPPLLYWSQFLNSTTLVHCPLVGQLQYCCTCVYLFLRALYKH